ncbi:MAG TPA: PH domain-containing protein [Nocardia sp.]|uniref:PH domain-containing protein n=1 Tax=Nocardia sp. TaxID=1821 RepID=UPI002B4B80CE|nr:PH domain-containing protein [Nocardia sp.]HLS78554.1 PH domain-containing protein [Nocardia sp.]
MDWGQRHVNPDSTPQEPRLTWSTPTPALIAVGVGGVALAIAAFFAADAPSKLLVGLAAAGLLGLAVLGFRQRPRLEVRPGPEPRLIVRSLLGPTEYRPEQLIRARIVSYRRLGRRTPMLEIDVRHGEGDRLLIFGRWDLGTDPQNVFDALVVHRIAALRD